MINKDTEHMNIHGQTKKLKDLDDKHLANLIHYITYYDKDNDVELIAVLLDIARERNLTASFIKNAPYPYINPYGREVIWDYRLGTTMLTEKGRNERTQK